MKEHYLYISAMICLLVCLTACAPLSETRIETRSGSDIAHNVRLFDAPKDADTQVAGCYGHYRPYTVRGKQYWIQPVPVGHMEKGLASWYGHFFHGRKTASGEYFNIGALTAAHKTLPLFSVVQVINLDNGRRVNVRINDRGPFIGDRIIDLSYSAAAKLDMLKVGVVSVSVEVTAVPYRTPLEGPLLVNTNPHIAQNIQTKGRV